MTDRPISRDGRIDLSVEVPFELGAATVDPAAHEIALAGSAMRIQPQTLKVLVALHDKVGHVATRNELIDRCWDGRILGEDVINRCICHLRRFAARIGGFEIETIPRGGYRLVEMSPPAKDRHRYLLMGGIGVAAAAAAAAGAIMLGGRSRRSRGRANPSTAFWLLPQRLQDRCGYLAPRHYANSAAGLRSITALSVAAIRAQRLDGTARSISLLKHVPGLENDAPVHVRQPKARILQVAGEEQTS